MGHGEQLHWQTRTLAAGTQPEATRLSDTVPNAGLTTLTLSPPNTLVTSQGSPQEQRCSHSIVPSCRGCHRPRQAGSARSTTACDMRSGSLGGDKRGCREPSGMILQKSKNKNAGMVTSGRAWGDLNGGSVPVEGQGKRPHAACPGSCWEQTGHGEREQQRRVSS